MGNGLAAVADLAVAVREGNAPRLDVLIVDASSGDPTLTMSCPSAAFLVSGLSRTAAHTCCTK